MMASTADRDLGLARHALAKGDTLRHVAGGAPPILFARRRFRLTSLGKSVLRTFAGELGQVLWRRGMRRFSF